MNPMPIYVLKMFLTDPPFWDASSLIFNNETKEVVTCPCFPHKIRNLNMFYYHPIPDPFSLMLKNVFLRSLHVRRVC